MKNSIEPKDFAEDQLFTEQLSSVPRADLVQPGNENLDDTGRLHWLLICPPDNWDLNPPPIPRFGRGYAP